MSEHDEQVAVIDWAELNEKCGRKLPELRLLHAIPNGGHRHKAVAGKLKAEGVKKGVPDLCLPVPKGKYPGLYIEMKKPGGAGPTDDQKKWLADLKEMGHYTKVCYGAYGDGGAIDILTRYLEERV